MSNASLFNDRLFDWSDIQESSDDYINSIVRTNEDGEIYINIFEVNSYNGIFREL